MTQLLEQAWAALTFQEPVLGTWLVLLGGYTVALLFVRRVLTEQRTAAAAWAWLLAMLLLPHLAVPAYLLFGGRHLRLVTRMFPDLEVPPGPETTPPGRWRAAAEGLALRGGAPTLPATHVAFHGDGVQAWQALERMIRSAERRVDVCTFILYRDEVGQALVDLLTERARQGVEVRLLLDAMGSIRALGRFVQPLRDAGGQVGVFLPPLPVRAAWSLNLRNHRKLLLIDGEQALVGGMNIGREYFGPHPVKGRWWDLVVELRGPTVSAVQTLFEEDWHIATGSHLPVLTPKRAKGGVPVQILADGPVFYQDAYSQLVLSALRLARRRVVLVSPYFIPDQPLLAAMAVAARTGVTVELLLPEHSNHPSADWARRPFVRELLQQGVVVRLYTEGMVHAKFAVVDRELAWVGSANLDARSITLNFELCAVVYDAPAAEQLMDLYDQLSARSRLLQAEELRSGPLGALAESVIWMLSPQL